MKKSIISLVLLLQLSRIQCQEEQKCASRDYGYGGSVCVCNSTYCDTISPVQQIEQPQYLVYTSNQNGLRFEKTIGEFAASKSAGNEIYINPDEKYQQILGWGGAFTDATGINIASLDEDAQDLLMQSYFSDNGIQYNLCRVPIGGTDFSTHGYSYNDGDSDPELTHFELAEEDHQYKIPFIKTASELSKNDLQLFASAWTAPKWMKTNGEYAGYGFLKPEMYQPWADYFVKFLDEYAKENVSFWGITTGNEPNTILVPENQINIVGWNSSEMGRWIVDNLGPTIRNSDHSDIKVMVYDDQTLFLPDFLDITLENNTAKDYVDGIAIHWYTNFMAPASLLSETHDHFPDKFLLSTEASNNKGIFQETLPLGSWVHGEWYSGDIIKDLQNWVCGWIDWNMVLDLTGGPTYINNFLDSPIIVNSTAGEFYKQPMFYHLGHFSKFIPRLSTRIGVNSTLDGNVAIVAFERPDNGTVVVLLNLNDEVVPVSLVNEERGTAQIQLSERSITTVLYW